MEQHMSGPHKFITDKFDKDTAVFFSKLSGAAYYTPKSFTHFLRKENIIDDNNFNTSKFPSSTIISKHLLKR